MRCGISRVQNSLFRARTAHCSCATWGPEVRGPRSLSPASFGLPARQKATSVRPLCFIRRERWCPGPTLNPEPKLLHTCVVGEIRASGSGLGRSRRVSVKRAATCRLTWRRVDSRSASSSSLLAEPPSLQAAPCADSCSCCPPAPAPARNPQSLALRHHTRHCCECAAHSHCCLDL